MVWRSRIISRSPAITKVGTVSSSNWPGWIWGSFTINPKISFFSKAFLSTRQIRAVSYTHLDVYKRQAQSQQSLTKLREITRCAFNAPTVLVVCGDTAAAWKNPFDGHCSAEMDASIVTTQMMLRAQELGIGTVWVCYFDRKQVAEYLGLPDHIVPYCLLPMGYAASGAVASPQHSDRKPLAETRCV